MSGRLDEVEEAVDPAADLGLGRALAARAGAQAVGDVLEDGHVAEEGVVLEDEAGAALLDAEAGGVLAVEEDAAGGRGLEAAEDAQERGLAGAGRGRGARRARRRGWRG